MEEGEERPPQSWSEESQTAEVVVGCGEEI